MAQVITELQVRALVFLIDGAKERGWVLPTPRELAEYLHPGHTGSSECTTALSIIKRLETKFGCFKEKSAPRERYVNTEVFVTEPESAHYVLMLRELCQSNTNKCTTKKELHATLATHSEAAYTPPILDEMFIRARRGEYIARESATLPGRLRPGVRVEELLPYLRVMESRGTSYQPLDHESEG